MVEGSISSLDSGPKSKEQVDALTPEDIAWVDSCLTKEVPDNSDGNWNHLKDALLEVIDLYPQGFESSLAVSDIVPGRGNDVEIDIDMLLLNNVKEPTFPSRDSDYPMNETEVASEDPQNNDDVDSSLSLSFSKNLLLPIYKEEDNVLGGTNDDIDIAMLLSSNNVKAPTFLSRDSNDPMNEAGIALEDPRNNDDIDASLSLSFSKNPFLPTYKEEEEGKDNIQTESSNELSESGLEPPINDIFQVWDLNLPQVEDEIVEQLNKALAENSVESVSSLEVNFSVLKDKEDLLDDLINGISDLSLEQNK